MPEEKNPEPEAQEKSQSVPSPEKPKPSMSFDERTVDLSKELVGKKDEEILDAVLAKDESDIMPWEPVTLPSRGLYYGDSIPNGVVEVRPMSLYTEKILSTPRLAKTGQAIDMIFKHCVRFPDPDFDPAHLLSGDGTFLFLYLRGITYGNEYEFTTKCSDEDCGVTLVKSFDLNNLQESIQFADGSLGAEPFEIKLPHMSKLVGRDFTVKVRLVRRQDMTVMANARAHMLDMEAKVKTKKDKKNKGFKQTYTINDTIEKNLNHIIVEAMGSTDKRKIEALVHRMHSSDAGKIREFLEENSPGVDTTIEVKCSECGNVMEVGLPITAGFFRGKGD